MGLEGSEQQKKGTLFNKDRYKAMNKYVFLALVLFYGCTTNNKKQTQDTDAEQAVVTVPTENQAEENPSYISDEPILLTEDKDSLVLKVYFGIMLRHKNLSGINYSYLRDIERALSAYIDKGFKRIDHFSDPLEREFALDTFRINETCRIFPPEDADEPAIHRKVFAYKRMAESDLISKYYNKCLESIKDEDGPEIAKAQAQWEESINCDRRLESTIMEYKYTGGGSMWSHTSYINLRSRSEFLFKVYQHLKNLEN